MIRRAWRLAILGSLALIAALAPLAGAQAPGEVGIVHTPPASPVPGIQIELTALLRNATSAEVRWNDGSMAGDAIVPMTNLSRSQDGGWLYEAWLPAEPDGTQVTYAINATGPSGMASQSYFVTVGVPTPTGLTDADQQAWIITLAASLTMAASAIVALSWYIGLRLRREETK
ncbi:MAG TPA: hypothetical protein VI999_08060 [Thermoplasmata archaeon]|nr:hypothetical protein [Thermoplasmata archaeon]